LNCVAVIGPTAVGKSSLAMQLSEILGGEIVSIDSRQIYRGLDIGTAKPSPEERKRVRHHCIDILDIEEGSNARWFASQAEKAIEDLRSRGRLPILAGGSGLYLQALTHGLFEIDLEPAEREKFAGSVSGMPSGDLYSILLEKDPESAGRIHPNDRYRIVRALEVLELTGTPLSEHFRLQKETGPPIEEGLVRIGLDMDRASLRSRISARTESMYDAGWPEEVTELLERGADPGCPGLQTLGYPETIRYVRGDAGRRETVERISILTGQYAKRQMTWFRKERDVTWLNAEDRDLLRAALNILDRTGIT